MEINQNYITEGVIPIGTINDVLEIHNGYEFSKVETEQ